MTPFFMLLCKSFCPTIITNVENLSRGVNLCVHKMRKLNLFKMKPFHKAEVTRDSAYARNQLMSFSLAFFVVFFQMISTQAENFNGGTWSDGICIYSESLPLEGYYVPPTVFNKKAINLEQVLAISRKMTPSELSGYVQAEKTQVSREHLLFAFKNYGMNVFLWKGKLDGQQQILVYAWDGEFWLPKSYSTGRTDAEEHLFFHPGKEDRCYVMVGQQSGQSGHDCIHTDRILFGSFPSRDTVIQKAIENSDTVVYIPSTRTDHQKSEFLDCLKGNITWSDFQKLNKSEQITYDTLVFIFKNAEGRRIRSVYARGSFRGDYGELEVARREMQTIPVEYQNRFDARWGKPGPLRWELAKGAFKTQLAGVDASCGLRLLNPEAPHGEWLFFELVVGRNQPASLYTKPMQRSQSDGGEALFSFKIRRNDTEVVLVPTGRFGMGSQCKESPEENNVLGIEYQFVNCGPGVVKIAMRPNAYPWKGSIQGTYVPTAHPWKRKGTIRRTDDHDHESEILRLNLE